MNNGAFGENFPYTNFHDLNLDWIVKIAKDFLDQYTNIQQTITDGLEGLENKAEELEALLQEWYDTHSSDIADQLADALNDLNEWYTEHQGYLEDYLSYSISRFNTSAETKAAQTLESIPSDYTDLYNTVNDNSDGVFHIPASDFQQGTLSQGTVVAMAYRVCTPAIHFYDHPIQISVDNGFMFALHFFDYNDTFTVSTPWLTSGYKINAGQKFKVGIRRVTEDTSESASESTFASKLDLTTYLGNMVLEEAHDYGVFSLPYGDFVQGTLNEGAIVSRAYRVCTPNIHSFSYPVTISVDSGFMYALNLFDNSDTYVSGTAWLTDPITLDTNQKFKLGIRRATENTNESAYEPEYANSVHLTSYIGSMVKTVIENINNDYLYQNYEIGGLNTVGTPVTRDFAIRTKDFIDTDKYNKFKIMPGYTITVCYYNKSTKEFITYNEIAVAGEYNFTPNMLSKITFRLTENYVTIADTNELSPYLVIYPAVLNDIVCSKYSWNAVGDSFTYGTYYVESVASKLLISNVSKYGVEGCTIAKNQTSEDDIIETFGSRYSRPTSIVERIANIPDANIFTIFGGTNDWYYDTTLGSMLPMGSSFDITTLYGALQTICENLQGRTLTPYILFITPTQTPRARYSTGTITYEQIVKAIKDVCALYAIPVLDLYHESNISIINITKTTIDGIHPSAVGSNMIVPLIANKMKEMVN